MAKPASVSKIERLAGSIGQDGLLVRNILVSLWFRWSEPLGVLIRLSNSCRSMPGEQAWPPDEWRPSAGV